MSVVIPKGFEPAEIELLRRTDVDYPDLDFDLIRISRTDDWCPPIEGESKEA